MSKLTLNVKAEVIARAKSYAKRHGQSVSGMVETYLDAVTENPKTKRQMRKIQASQPELPPILRELLGSLEGADPDAYKKHLMAKYG